ncbi:MAG: hypothetical protein GYB68_15265 [Chloroflexi bacterium]|nr:hypothetical protein [Chloroflexota bacterium]
MNELTWLGIIMIVAGSCGLGVLLLSGLLALWSWITLALTIRDTLEGEGRWALNLKAVQCPRCGLARPITQLPRSPRQIITGERRCRRCNQLMDRQGRALPD